MMIVRKELSYKLNLKNNLGELELGSIPFCINKV